ncbi:MAG: CpaF family protein [Lachnospiraceae bacterium]|nr:CpaF family protein [Lachnospiraceae bacterium]
MSSYKEIFEKIHKELLDSLDFTEEITDEEMQEKIDEFIVFKNKKIHLTLKEKEGLRKDLFASVRKLDILQELVDDPAVTEIMVNGTGNIFIERDGKIKKWERRFESEEKLNDVVQQIVSGCNRVVNEASPIVDARLSNGSRVNVVLNPIALNGPIITIRRFPDVPITMEKLIEIGSVSKEAALFLQKLVQARYNIFISGGTGSGKTTFLNALSAYIPKDERIITIEDNAELQIQGVPNLVKLETRNANLEGCAAITIRDLIKSSLRMRPDRIIVGEVRGGEAIDMMQAYNSGHDGSMSTGHSNGTADMLSRLETMILMGMDLPLMAIKQQIASGIDIIIHLGRLRDKTRKVLEIAEVDKFQDGKIYMHTLYKFEEHKESMHEKVMGTLGKKGELLHGEKLKMAGIAL